MPDADLVIHDGTLVTTESEFPGVGLAIAGGVITAVARDEDLPAAKRRLDAHGNYLLPGIIDDHVHFREPGLTYKEDFGTGSLAAIMGGVTCVCDMPNTLPPTSTAELVGEKQRLAGRHSYVDFGIFGLVAQDNVAELGSMAEAGVIGFKCYLGETTGGIPAPDDGMLLDEMGLISRLGLRIGFHAENNAIMQHRIRLHKAQGDTRPVAHLSSRPVICEEEAIQRVALFAKQGHCKIHICHLSSEPGLDLVREWRMKGVDVTCETGPQYCFLPLEVYDRVGSVVRMNPPVRGTEREALVGALASGEIECIATDHSPHTPEEKVKDDIWQALSGFVGVETSAQLFLSEAVNAGTMTLPQFVGASSTNPARVWGIKNKGRLAAGFDGDVTIVDMAREWVIDRDKLHSRTRVTPFDRWRGRGQAVVTIVRGQVVMEDGQLVGDPLGRMVVRA